MLGLGLSLGLDIGSAGASAPPEPEFGTPYVNTAYNGASANTVVHTVQSGQARAVGDVVAIWVQWFRNDGTISSVTDSAGNTYTAGTQVDAEGNVGQVRAFRSKLTNPLPEGGTITATFSLTNTTGKFMMIATVSGADAIDRNVNSSVTTSSTAVVTTGALAQAEEVMFAAIFTNTSAPTTPLPSGWVELRNATNNSVYYKFSSSTTTETANFPLPASQLWYTQLMTFTKAA